MTELVAPGIVNTMPEKTLEATFDHGVIEGDTVTGAYGDAGRRPRRARTRGRRLRRRHRTCSRSEGVDKFIVSWNELLETVRGALEAAR